MTTGLFVGFAAAPLEALGPGRRIGLWLCGCTLQCPGCVSRDLWRQEPESWRDMDALLADLRALKQETMTDALTISGGEPFQQAEALRLLLAGCRALGYEDILVYTGYSDGYIQQNHPWVSDLASALVAGPYERSKPSDLAWRGSANQTLMVFQDKLSQAYEAWRLSKHRRLQIFNEESHMRIVGIPRVGEYEKLMKMLEGWNEDGLG